ncbi:related to acetylcholinesterase precursor [Phialocephala subalpina]|uniref:Carboxylic ester hydrolase n=1 Tax=Phialocephala subalpina TaxID=576137 RepID=A0A1L7XLU4_9HELO|nr:related to acetylcholinesterase precursor [Phialocephala subalpina]
MNYLLLSLLVPIAVVGTALVDTVDNNNDHVGQQVGTTSGFVIGHPAPNASQVSEYLGIPYAKPPVGQLRFAPPVAYVNPSGRVDGSNFCSDCPANTLPISSVNLTGFPENARNIFLMLDQVGHNQSEDCLSLNVWTKPKPGQKMPVLLWLYGGSYQIGTSHASVSSGQHLADTETAVVVSINYRLNIFGFPGLPGHPQNVGLQDQRLAVEWVRDNIAAFGGDPDRITLVGQSAGASSVDFYSYAYTEDPIVGGFILQSGTATAFGITQHDNLAAWWTTSVNLGCGAQGVVALAASLSCVRGKPFTDVLAAAGLASANGNFLGAFAPTIDETLVFSDYEARSLAGNFIQAPVLVGNTDYEAGFLGLVAPAYYASLSPADRTAYNLVYFECPTAKAAFLRALHGVPTWRYRWFGQYPNTYLFPGSGAWHESEIGFVFGTMEEMTKMANVPVENEVQQYMMSAWAGFAREPKTALTELGWPKYNATKQTLVRLGNENETTASFTFPSTFDTACISAGQSTGL